MFRGYGRLCSIYHCLFALYLDVISMIDYVLSVIVCLLFLLVSKVCSIVYRLSWFTFPLGVTDMLDYVLTNMVCLLKILVPYVCLIVCCMS